MIWIVTDRRETADALIPLIRDKGYDVGDADCGETALQRLRFRRPTLAVIDCGLADSFKTLETMRKDQHLRDVPVLMFSDADNGYREKAMLLGADGYVAKGSLDWLELLTELVRLAGPPSRAN
jgi:DNA-binding response OmpR family regulator